MEEQNWQTVINPASESSAVNFKEIWKYRDLILLFVKRDFISKYKQTVLGPMWALIQPLMTTVVFSVVFGNLAKLTISDIKGVTLRVPSFLFYMIGTVTWTYFSTTLNSNARTFIVNRSIMGKVYYPRMVNPISTAISGLIPFGIQMIMFVVLMFICRAIGIADVHFSLYLLLFPALVVQMMMLSTGIGIIISSLTTKYRDLSMLVGFGLQLWQYLSPVPYGLGLIPEKYLFLYTLNPVTPIITTMRYAFFGIGYFDSLAYGISIFVTIAFFSIGIKLFNRIERTFMDTV